MSSQEFNTKDLYVVRPSVVIEDLQKNSFDMARAEADFLRPPLRLARGQIRAVKAGIRRQKRIIRIIEQGIREGKINDMGSFNQLEKAKMQLETLESYDLTHKTLGEMFQSFKHEKAMAKVELMEKININNVIHTVTFENSLDDVSIAIPRPMPFKFILNDIVDNRTIYEGYTASCNHHDYYVGVLKGDKIPLAQYLWERNVPGTDYNNQIDLWVTSLRPIYTIEEIKDLLIGIREDLLPYQQEPYQFTITKEGKPPIYTRTR